ncbi:HNMT [Branchiostoma lanceolatum]|uniref:HNMT protein n=1 Tax=Branchiostoma lanceolatum TaxID=7740 RepID=A0A8J9Z5N1_BRALA|nr:HNMT [Branchiostoma lanceolatum]
METVVTGELGGIARRRQHYEIAYRSYLDACSGRQYYLQLLGEADSVILRKLQEIHHNTHVIVVEPSEDYISEYKEQEALMEHEPDTGRLTFDWLQQRAEEYFSQEAGDKCHLIHAIHVLYHVDDLSATLMNMWDSLADGGSMVVMIESGESNLGRWRLKVLEALGVPEDKRMATCLRVSSDVMKILDDKNIDYSVTSTSPEDIDVTECFKEGSESGELLLDFLIQTAYVSLNPELRLVLLQYLDSPEFFPKANDRVVITQYTDVIVAKKKSTGV